MAETNEPESTNNSSELPEGWVEIQPKIDPAWFTPEGWEEFENEEPESKAGTSTTKTTIQTQAASQAEETMPLLSKTYPDLPPCPVRQEGENQDDFEARLAGWNKQKLRDTLAELGIPIVKTNGGGYVITGIKSN